MKPKVVKDYDKLDVEIQEQIKLFYPYGFADKLITFKNIKGSFVSALPFETDDKSYLIRMTKVEAKEIILEDSDYDENGMLKDEVMEEYNDKYEVEEIELDEEDMDDEDNDDMDDDDDV